MLEQPKPKKLTLTVSLALRGQMQKGAVKALPESPLLNTTYNLRGPTIWDAPDHRVKKTWLG